MQEGGSATSDWIRCRQSVSRGRRKGNRADDDPEIDEGEIFGHDFHCNVWETLHGGSIAPSRILPQTKLDGKI